MDFWKEVLICQCNFILNTQLLSKHDKEKCCAILLMVIFRTHSLLFGEQNDTKYHNTIPLEITHSATTKEPGNFAEIVQAKAMLAKYLREKCQSEHC